jgi:hypothetical protein
VFIFLFYLRRLPVVLLLMPSLRQWFPFQEVHTRIPMSPLGIDGLDYWLGLNHGICNGNITVAISWSDYFTGLLEVAESTCRNGFKWIT